MEDKMKTFIGGILALTVLVGMPMLVGFLT
jgi:hypothetical protein